MNAPSRLIAAFLLLHTVLATPAPAQDAKDPLMRMYFGSYSKDRAQGIFLGEIDPATGKLTITAGYGGVKNPTFLALGHDGRFLYCVAEVSDLDGKPGGGAAAYRIDPSTGALELLNVQNSGGGGACHITLDPAGNTAIVSNYGGGSVASFPIQDDGTLAPAASFHQHAGKAADPKRQTTPHTHSANFSPSGGFVVVADLGIDQLLVYRLDAETSKLTPHDPPFFKLHDGAGPRHFAFHPEGKHAYVINELDMTLTTMAWDEASGVLTFLQKVDTLPPDADRAGTSTAEVVVHPSGRFVYGSNRGHDSIAIFAVDPDVKTLTPLGHEPTRGRTPRNFALDPSGRWLIACNQGSDTAQVFRVDQNTGMLSAVGEPVPVPTPVCVRFVTLRQD